MLIMVLVIHVGGNRWGLMIDVGVHGGSDGDDKVLIKLVVI